MRGGMRRTIDAFAWDVADLLEVAVELATQTRDQFARAET